VQKNYELFNTQTNQIESVPHDAVSDYLASGVYAPKKGDKFNIAFQDSNEVGTVDSSEVLKALQSGGTLRPFAEVQQESYEQQYGDPLSAGLAGAAGAARGLSFGLSDQLLTKTGLVDADTLKGLESANPISSNVGEVGAIVGSALLSGGTSAAAKGAQALGSGVSAVTKGAAAAGVAVEKLLMSEAAKAGVKKSIAKSLAAKMAPKVVEGGIEGAAFGAGKLLSENALGDIDLNAENLLAAVGPGALIGGGLGAMFGAANAIAPTVEKFGQRLTRESGSIVDKVSNAYKQIGGTPAQAAKLKSTKFGKEFLEELPDFAKSEMKWNLLDDAVVREQKALAVKDAAGAEIGKIADELEVAYMASKGEVPLMRDYANKVVNKLQELRAKTINAVKTVDDEVTVVTGAAPTELINPALEPSRKLIDDQISFYQQLATSKDKLSPSQLNKFRLEADELARWDAVVGDAKKDIFREIRGVAREEFDNYARSVSPSLAKLLKEQNKKFSYSSEIADTIKNTAERSRMADVGGSLKDMAAAAAGGAVFGGPGAVIAGVGRAALNSDARRNAAVLFDLEKAAQETSKYIAKTVGGVFSGAKNVVPKVAPLKVAESALSYDYSGDKVKKPKDVNQALQNLAKNVDVFTTSPDKFLALSARNSSPYYQYAPNILDAADRTSLASLAFLAQKIPKRTTTGGIFDVLKKSPLINSQEMAKLERYLTAIENPKSVFSDLSHGKLSREGVEVLKSVYPKLYQQAQDAVASKIDSEGDNLTYQQKLQLGTLLDIPADASMAPANVMGLQTLFAAPPSSTPSISASINVAEKYESATAALDD